MSSNKTIIPGMEDAYLEKPSSFSHASHGVQGGTSVPNPFSTTAVNVSGKKPIVGFLYSISRTGAGEFWPLHIGSNTIGRAAESNVCLNEATVSDQHAVLVVRQMKNPEKIIASICDSRSTCGTMINGESLGFDPRECFNGDIITIGEHYDLFFILVDAKEIGLSVCRDFISTQQNNAELGASVHNNNPYAAPNGSKFTQGYGQETVNSRVGTVGFDEPEQNPINKPGGTIFM